MPQSANRKIGKQPKTDNPNLSKIHFPLSLIIMHLFWSPNRRLAPKRN